MSAAGDVLVVDPRFRGPPESANGGYVAGVLAGRVDGPAEVTLRVPPPLGRPLAVRGGPGATVALLDGETLVAEARPATVDLDVPPPVGPEAAHPAAEAYPWHDRHPYPTCFVCGPRRAPGDGLRIFPGPVPGAEVYAAPWTPGADLAPDGDVAAPFVWAALDCPSGIATDAWTDVGPILLGRLAADLRRPVRAGAPHVVQAWRVARDGRKLHTASALFDAGGAVCAVARATWIELRGA